MPRFEAIGRFKIYVELKGDDDDTILNKLITKKALYHDKCYKQFDKRNLEREQKRATKRKMLSLENIDAETNYNKIPRIRCNVVKELVCIFCKKAEDKHHKLHAAASSINLKINSREDKEQVKAKTKHWREMATIASNYNLIGVIGTTDNPLPGDLRSREVFYHLKCYSQATQAYKQMKLTAAKQEHLPEKTCEKDFIYNLAFKTIYSYMQTNLGKMIKLVDLEDLFSKVLLKYNLYYTKHSSRFLKMLQSAIPDVKCVKSDSNTLFVHLDNVPTSSLLTGKTNDQKFAIIEQAAKILKQCMKSHPTPSSKSLDEKSQLKSVPLELITFLTLLFQPTTSNDLGDMLHNIPQPLLTIAQLIQFNRY